LKHPLSCLYAVLISFTVLNCAPADAQGRGKLETREFFFETRGTPGEQGPAIVAEIASTADERSRGLMERTKLPDGEGMLFVFEKDQTLSFWMKNTLIPLSIAYISSGGGILEIHDMKPQDLTPIHSSRSARYALEVPQGWFARAGIAVDDRLLLDL
jgi:uncharacterized membrane protein (UPF0127 family)